MHMNDILRTRIQTRFLLCVFEIEDQSKLKYRSMNHKESINQAFRQVFDCKVAECDVVTVVAMH